MSNFNNTGELQISDANGHIKTIRRPRRSHALMPGAQFETFTNAREEVMHRLLTLLESDSTSQEGELQANEEAKLLTLLHQELKDIHEGMIRTNTALFELIDEMKLLRKSTSEASAA